MNVPAVNKIVRSASTEKGNKVRFRLADVFLPNVEELRALFDFDEDIEGTVIDFSDSGTTRNAFAVLEVVRQMTVLVPVGKLQVARGFGAAQNEDSKNQ